MKQFIHKHNFLFTVVDPTTAGKMTWLQGQRNISSGLRSTWEETWNARYNNLVSAKGDCRLLIRKTGSCQVDSYITRYPFLRQHDGPQLVNIIFFCLVHFLNNFYII